MSAPLSPQGAQSDTDNHMHHLLEQGFYKPSAPKPVGDAGGDRPALSLPPPPIQKRMARRRKRKRVVASPVGPVFLNGKDVEEEQRHPEEEDEHKDGEMISVYADGVEDYSEDADVALVVRDEVITGCEATDEADHSTAHAETKRDGSPTGVQLVFHGEAASVVQKAVKAQATQINMYGTYANNGAVESLLRRPSIEPKTRAWFEKRYNIVTGTQIGLLASGPAASKRLKKDKAFLVPRRDLSAIPAVRHGNENEHKAADLFASLTGIALVPKSLGLYINADHQVGATPDFVTKYIPWLLEIKCPFSRVPDGTVLAKYKWQMWQQMFVTGIHQCFFVEFVAPSVATQENPAALHVSVVRFDGAAQSAYNRILRLVGPFLRDAYVLRCGRTEPPEADDDDEGKVLTGKRAEKAKAMF